MSAILKIPDKKREQLNSGLSDLVDDKVIDGILKIETTENDIILIIDFTSSFNSINNKLNKLTETMTGKIMFDNVLKFFK